MDKPYIAADAAECKQRAEDPKLPTDERLVWAQLATAAELRSIHRALAARRR
ncbi:hypothetical protein [Streptomyces olivaceus]|uniref:hypothetical protein n=1 Tax=Streptomyces olivaceus TaxID=47716 RepID=UPI0022EF7055|nr:hypothetical protein [Streptomyces olivaceus]GHI91276.1 hypothetical protein TPA0905_07470 [Streptomyces olivaceus]